VDVQVVPRLPVQDVFGAVVPILAVRQIGDDVEDLERPGKSGSA
jgi:hypothetical protein